MVRWKTYPQKFLPSPRGQRAELLHEQVPGGLQPPPIAPFPRVPALHLRHQVIASTAPLTIPHHGWFVLLSAMEALRQINGFQSMPYQRGHHPLATRALRGSYEALTGLAPLSLGQTIEMKALLPKFELRIIERIQAQTHFTCPVMDNGASQGPRRIREQRLHY